MISTRAIRATRKYCNFCKSINKVTARFTCTCPSWELYYSVSPCSELQRVFEMLTPDLQKIGKSHLRCFHKKEEREGGKKTSTSSGVIRQLLISIRHRRGASTLASTSGSLDIINDVGSLMGWNRGGRRGRAGRVGPRWRSVVEWKGVQSISHKSVCTARSPNAATLSSYSFDRDSLGLCTQSLMALFKDRNRSMSGASACSRARVREERIRPGENDGVYGWVRVKIAVPCVT